MTLRLVLVGIVAALGVSIPSQPSSESWFRSAEAWATSILAEWDTWEPTDGEEANPTRAAISLPVRSAGWPGCEWHRKTLRAAAGDSPAPKPVAFEPIRVTEPFDSGIAYELNRLSDGLSTPAVTSPDTVATTANSESPLPEDAFEIAAWDELFRNETERVEVATPVIVERSIR